MRLITEADVAGRLAWPDVVDAIARGHARGHEGAAAMEGTDSFLHRGDDTMLSRAAWIDGLGVGVKSVTVMPSNAARDLPSVHGAMIVFDDTDGRVRAVIDSALVTRWKTAADSLLGAKLLARPDPKRLVILGAGAVADSLCEGYPAIFPTLQDIAVHNRTRERAEALASRCPDVRVSDDLHADLAAADIVATATMSSTPVLRGAWVRPGTHVDLIGAFTPAMREADDDLMRAARIFADSRDTVLDHIGELAIPLAEGTLTRDDVLGDLTDLVAGRVGREGNETTVFKNGGGAHLDLMVADHIVRVLDAG